MADRWLTDTARGREELVRRYDAFKAAGGNRAEAARALGLARSTISESVGLAEQLMAAGELYQAPPEGPKGAESVETITNLNREVAGLRKELRAVTERSSLETWIRSTLSAIPEANLTPPDWSVDVSLYSGSPGVPMLMLSDLHWGEVVHPAEVHGVNGYNMDTAAARLRHVVEMATIMFKRHLTHADYPGLVLFLGGDILSGIIHNELTVTNEASIMRQLLDAVRNLSAAVRTLADEFGNVDIWCVPGNHGRTTHRPQFKDYAGTSFDWLLYHVLTMTLQDRSEVTWHIPDGREVIAEVAGRRFLLLHGDQFRGGDGIIGPLGPIARGDVRKRHSYSMMPTVANYDYMCLGHFHQYLPGNVRLVNGSLKGMDEYALGNNLAYEPPTQAAWTVHPEHGITWHCPIYAGEFKELWPG